MTIGSINPIQSVTGTGYLTGVQGMQGLQGAQGTQDSQGTGGSAFGSALVGAVDNLQQLAANSNTLAVKAVTGSLTDIHSATIASARAQVTLELVAAVRNKGVDAFNEIMRMQA